ncbi:COBRA-like protein 7 [Ricinus communis]|uniref:Protein COBRA, putative n=1 Tax=Ricinus communis TaxID=3988 RepID=B9SAX3_RICCO|nr:COBRA-like protein 7 [Ricinus communis]EEF39327.1 Protein COBRA precursor, putative [Ricinus communis]|eukprot:XP_002523142.1 COBRA-like protein 7 [Ricinus communis]
MANNINNLLIIISITLSFFFYTCFSQPSPSPPPNATCNGVYLSYSYTRGYLIPPTDDSTNQPYRFESTVKVLNNGRDELKSWRVFVGFNDNELLVSATNAVLADGTSFPASVGNGTVLVGFPRTDLKTAIETAGDTTQTEVTVLLVGTRFVNGNPDDDPLPANLTLANHGYSCPVPTRQGNELQLCCTKDLNATPNTTPEDNFQPREDGDLVIMYDVINTYDTNYWAQVSISNHKPFGRLDNWKLSWDWMRGEFIFAMKGAYPYVVDTSDCIFGEQGQHYKDMDFSNALNCEKRPTIVDLPPTRANDSTIGMIPFCCRNGTILPPNMDLSKSVSVFLMQVFKMPPYLNRTELVPPQNWKINGTMNSDFTCGSPVRVSPSQFPDPSGLPSRTAAVASWQVVCNITHFKEEKPKCCVSFSAFFNDSVVPCNTCACGCNNNPSQTCNANEPALLMRPDALLVPFENRTLEALEWASIKKRAVPNPLPCGDNCGVSINWHLLSDYRNGWTARITLFNWGETDYADWFAAVQLDKAMPGFEKVYSFNGSVLPNYTNTIFMQGLADFNYLLAERDGDNPRKDPRVPGTLQSVISFTKKKTPGIDVPGEDGFPTKVLFNGEDCAIPTVRPINSGHKSSTAASVFSSILILALFLMQS